MPMRIDQENQWTMSHLSICSSIRELHVIQDPVTKIVPKRYLWARYSRSQQNIPGHEPWPYITYQVATYILSVPLSTKIETRGAGASRKVASYRHVSVDGAFQKYTFLNTVRVGVSSLKTNPTVVTPQSVPMITLVAVGIRLRDCHTLVTIMPNQLSTPRRARTWHWDKLLFCNIKCQTTIFILIPLSHRQIWTIPTCRLSATYTVVSIA